ncbi:MAG: DUF2480 family protein [Flavobacteriales bacterium]|nr:DUF2480 family protein [Flavobacteriales bacterium]MCX7769226.1 DUF2480 family protein [Flavobacteriales bacterium]MDW8410421.1 DUF2480 family protein [Flavobacteriales bacterium]
MEPTASAGEIRNRVSEAALLVVNLGNFKPTSKDLFILRLSEVSGGEPILRERLFREALASYDVQKVNGRIVVIENDLQGVVQPWAWMLLSARLMPCAEALFPGPWQATHEAEVIIQRFSRAWPPEKLHQQRLFITGCGDIPAAAEVYCRLTAYVLPHVRSLMYGEACSAVPVYKSASKELKPASPGPSGHAAQSE